MQYHGNEEAEVYGLVSLNEIRLETGFAVIISVNSGEGRVRKRRKRRPEDKRNNKFMPSASMVYCDEINDVFDKGETESGDERHFDTVDNAVKSTILMIHYAHDQVLTKLFRGSDEQIHQTPHEHNICHVVVNEIVDIERRIIGKEILHE